MHNLVPRRDDLFAPIEAQFEKFFTDFFEVGNRNVKNILKDSSYPKLNVITTDTEFIFEAAVPGVSAEDLKVDFIPGNQENNSPNILQISGKVEKEHVHNNVSWHLREIKRSAFNRQIVLPDNNVQFVGEPSTMLDKGILTIKWSIRNKDTPKEVKKIIINSK